MEYIRFMPLLIAALVLFAGCNGGPQCLAPYSEVEGRCCLDANQNQVCDELDTTTTTSTTTTTTETTTTSTTTSTTTTSTTSTTTTTHISERCGEKRCMSFLHTECVAYTKVSQVCIDSKTLYLCDLKQNASCGKGCTCVSDVTGDHCACPMKSVQNNIADRR